MFTPKIGEDFQFDKYLSDGLKPPTSYFTMGTFNFHHCEPVFQLSVNLVVWGLVVWIFAIPEMNPGLLLRGAPRIPNHWAPNHQFTINMYQLKWQSLDMSYAAMPMICAQA